MIAEKKYFILRCLIIHPILILVNHNRFKNGINLLIAKKSVYNLYNSSGNRLEQYSSNETLDVLERFQFDKLKDATV